MIDSPDDTSRTGNGERNWLDHAAVYAAVAAALAAAAAAGVGAWQGYVANQALEISRTANEIAIRPYIRIELLPDTFVAANHQFKIQTQVTNTGKLPAMVNVQGGLGWDYSSNTPHAPSIARPDHLVGSVFIFPGQSDQTTKFTVESRQLSEGEWIDLTKSPPWKFYAFIYGQYGPKGRLTDYLTKVCTAYQMGLDNGVMKLGLSEPCPEDSLQPNAEPKNYAQ